MTGTIEKANRLSKTRLFEGISEEKLLKIAHVVEKKTMSANSTVFRQGETGDSFYIMSSGKVRVFRKSEEGVETDLSLLGPGDCFGEMALLTDQTRSAQVETLEKTRFFILTKDQFDQVLKNDPNISVAFFKQMASWLVRDEIKIGMEAERQSQAPKISYFDYIVVIGISLICGIIFNLVNPNGIDLLPRSLSGEPSPSVDLQTTIEKYRGEGVVFIDARPSYFYDKEHLKGALSMPLALFDIMYMMDLGDLDKSKEIIVYGRNISSRYDQKVARKLMLRGHRNTSVLKGGLPAWKEKGYPLEP